MSETKFFRTTIKGGLLFLIPIGFVVLVLGKAFELILNVAEPIAEILPIKGVAGFIVINVLALIILMLLCFLAGLLSNRPWFRSSMSKLEEVLLSNIPMYSFVDGMRRSVSTAEGEAANMMPVLAHFDDNTQLGFEVERTPLGAVVIYLPGSPNPWSGTTVFMPHERVEPLNMKTHEAMKLLRLLGRGTSRFAGRRFNYEQPEEYGR